MLLDDPETGVVIADERSGLRLCRVGEANELGYPTLIEVRAGPFSGSIRDDTVTGFQRFVGQLETRYETLSGTAELNSHKGFRLSMTGGGRRGIGVSVVVIGEHVPSIKLTFGFVSTRHTSPESSGPPGASFRPTARCKTLDLCNKPILDGIGSPACTVDT
jgi:hypothetical protein